MESNNNIQKILIGTIGYHNLRNHSIGPHIFPSLQKMDWPLGIEVDEMNWGPIAIVQKFQSLETPYDKVIFICAIERLGRKIGEITLFKWMGKLPDGEELQARIGDAVTGVISVENLLIIGEHFQIWPKDCYLVDMEPGPEQAGHELTLKMEMKIPSLINTIKALCFDDDLNQHNFHQLFGDKMMQVHE